MILTWSRLIVAKRPSAKYVEVLRQDNPLFGTKFDAAGSGYGCASMNPVVVFDVVQKPYILKQNRTGASYH